MGNINSDNFDICECGSLKSFSSWNGKWFMRCTKEENKGDHVLDTQKDLVQKVRNHYRRHDETVSQSSFYRITRVPFASLADYFSGIDALKKACGFSCSKIKCGRRKS